MGPFIMMYWVPIWFETDKIEKEKYKKEINTAISYRKKTEHLFPYGAELTDKILSKISQETQIETNLLRVLSAEELLNYFTKKVVPDRAFLQKRTCGFIYSKKGLILTDNSPTNFKKIINFIGYEYAAPKHKDAKEIKGQTACGGIAKGKARVIMSKKDILFLLNIL